MATPVVLSRRVRKRSSTGGFGRPRDDIREADGLSAARVQRSNVVFAVSSGVVSSYDDEGGLVWQDRRGPKWATQGTPVVSFAILFLGLISVHC